MGSSAEVWELPYFYTHYFIYLPVGGIIMKAVVEIDFDICVLKYEQFQLVC